jgi:hypothetical protein
VSGDIYFYEVDLAAGAVCNCGKAGALFAKAFPNSLWKSFEKKLPKATLIDFHSSGSFHSASRPHALETPGP